MAPTPSLYAPVPTRSIRFNLLNSSAMNDSLKNPFVVFIAGLLLLWLVYYLLKLTISFFWIVVLAFIILFVVNDRFRRSVRVFLNGLFKN